MKSVRVYLLTLVGACIVMAGASFLLIIAQMNGERDRQTALQSQETAQAISRAVDGKIENALGVLSALRASRAFRQEDWPAVSAQARAALKDPDAWLVVHDRDGRQYVNSRLETAALPVGPPPVEMWQALKGGRDHVCNLSRGQVERQILCVDVGARTGRGRLLAMSVIFRPHIFQPIVSRQALESGMLASLVDRKGVIIWRNLRPENFVGKSATGQVLELVAHGAKSGHLESRSLEGVPMLSAIQRSDLSGWTVVVGTPKEQALSLARRAVWRGAALSLLVLALGAALSIWLGRRITLGVKRLERAAQSGGSAEPAPVGLAEFDSVAKALHRYGQEQERDRQHRDVLIGELNHRVKNMLAIVQSLALQTFRNGDQAPGGAAKFEARLGALSAAHSILTREQWEQPLLREIIEAAVAPFCTIDRCEISGPEIKIAPQSAVSFALVAHELATNAVKYGALSVPDGRIAVRWSVDGDDFEFEWQESGGPPPRPEATPGFGTRLITRTLSAELRGGLDLTYDPVGFRLRARGKASALSRITGKLPPVGAG